MGKLRTANNRRNRAIRQSAARAHADANASATGAQAATAKTASKPVKAAS